MMGRAGVHCCFCSGVEAAGAGVVGDAEGAVVGDGVAAGAGVVVGACAVVGAGAGVVAVVVLVLDPPKTM
jgi:hypothetical protein